MLVASGLGVSTVPALADHHDRDDGPGWGGFGSHPTLPVPGALVFGAIAVSAAAAAARRRHKPKDDAQSEADSDTSTGK